MSFEKFQKIPRLSKGWSVSEKIDGTNAQIHIIDDLRGLPAEPLVVINGRAILAGSRNRYVYRDDDNYSFAHWVYDNAEDLLRLGPGRHYGEWFGEGIQKNPLGVVGRRLAMFNPRWADQGPECVEVVPQLGVATTVLELDRIFTGLYGRSYVKGAGELRPAAAEGIIAYHLGSGQLYKQTYDFPEGKWR